MWVTDWAHIQTLGRKQAVEGRAAVSQRTRTPGDRAWAQLVSSVTALPTPLSETTHLVLTEDSHPQGVKNGNFKLAKQRVIYAAVTSGNLQEGRRSYFNPNACVHTVCKTKGGAIKKSPNVPGTFPGREAKTLAGF